MRTPLAWHNLWHQPVRSGVAVIGVTFAAVLMFMQLGFLEAVKASATVIYDVLDFDICLRSRDYDRFSDPRSFDRGRLTEAHAIKGVTASVPFWVAVLSWRNPQTGEPRAILTLGVENGQRTFHDPALQKLVDQTLEQPQSMLVDTLTRREFGPANGFRFSSDDLGRRVEINDKQLEMAGLYRCGSGINAGGGVIVNHRDFLRCQPLLLPNHVSLGLVQCAAEANVDAVARQLRGTLPEDIEVLTRAELLDSEIHHWVWQTNYGLIFQSGVLVAVIVGTAIVYQVLASEVTSRMPEYATLKAMGYGNGYLVRVMVEQSLLLAIIAFLAGWAVAAVLYQITAVGAQIPIRMTAFNSVLVLVLTATLCVVSGVAAIRKAYLADPAELF